MAHTLSLDSWREPREDVVYQALCSCGWNGDIVHTHDLDGVRILSDEDAETSAVEDGSEHIAYL